MKANFQHLGFEQVHDSFLCYWVKSDFFGFHWHYHPEMEITCVKKGRKVKVQPELAIFAIFISFILVPIFPIFLFSSLLYAKILR